MMPFIYDVCCIYFFYPVHGSLTGLWDRILVLKRDSDTHGYLESDYAGILNKWGIIDYTINSVGTTEKSSVKYIVESIAHITLV